MDWYEYKAEQMKKKNKKTEEKLSNGGVMDWDEYLSTQGVVYNPENNSTTEDRSGLFKKSEGNPLQTIGGTLADLGISGVKGALGGVENPTDLVRYGLAGINDLLGKEERAEFWRLEAMQNDIDNEFAPIKDKVEKYSVSGDVLDDMAGAVGYIAALKGVGKFGQMAGLGEKGVGNLVKGAMFTSAMGGGMTEAYYGNATDKEALTYGALTGTTAVVIEGLVGGLGKALKVKGFSDGKVDKYISKFADMITKNTTLKNTITTVSGALGEGVEEVAEGFTNAFAKKFTYMSEEDIWDIMKDEKLGRQFWIGTLASAVSQMPSYVSANKSGVDLETGLTSNEQKVVDAEVQNRISEQEKTGDKKLTSKDKAAIKEQVMTDIKRGGISIDTIESVLGGETYNNYKTITDKETSLNEQIKTLNNEISDLRKAPKTIEVEERYTEAKQELKALENELKEFNQTSNKAEIQAQLHQEVDNLTQNDRFIRESYNEKARVYQSLDIDLSKYDAKRQEAIKTLTEDVKLNNTKKTHEAVELLSKVAVDRNLKVKLVDKAFMQKQGEIEGVVKNAYITKDGEMFINIESPKYAETLAVHEVLHDMKNKTPEIYTELENAIIDFAKTKGIYDSRLKSIKETYFKLKGQEISEELAREEVAASLSEDYIATDEEFVRNLSVKQPNVFKRIYEELKYLWKIATAGSKEKRQLEKAKKLYDKVYRESANVNTTESVKNNTSEVIESIETSTEEDIAPIKEKASSEDGVFFDAQKGNTNFSLSEDMSIEEKINSSMTMKEAKDMLQRAYNSGDIRGYRNADEWLNEMGAEDVAMTLESDYPLYKKYIESNEDILNEEYSIQDVLEAYLNGTLTGKAKESAIRLDTSKDTGFIDDRFYAPQDIKGGQDLYNIANQRVTNTNRAEVYKARADFIINAHNKGYIESLGLTREEVNKKLKTWANYTQKAMNLSNSLNEGVATQNRWTGIENSTILNTISVSDKEMGNLVKSIEGHSNEWQRQYITSTMLALDTHINYKDLSFEFDDKGMSSNTALGEYNDRERKIRIRVAGQNTVAHEMGHYIDHSWGRDLGYTGSDGLTGRGVNLNKLNPEQKQFVKNFYNFLNDIENSSDIGSSYKMASNEVFARFVARFTEWTKNQATNNRYGYEAKWYQDNFNERQYREFVKILQEKAMLDTTIPSSKAETRYSLSEEVSNIAPTRSWGVRVKDMKLEEAPVREEPTESVKTVQETDYAPLTAFDAFIRDTEQENPDFENYIPDEVEAPYYEPEGIKVDDPFYERDIKDVGDRKVKAYMYENPEVKPFFQQEAQAMLYELENSIKGEKQYNDHLYAESGGEKGWFGTKRTTSDDIAYLLDNFKYTYADIKKGLNAIIEDNGKENNAISKRIEFALNDRLKDGYTDFLSGYEVPANQDYINLLAEKQINAYSDEAYNEWVKSLADLPSQDIAPVRADITSVREVATVPYRNNKIASMHQNDLDVAIADDLAEIDKIREYEQIAEVLDETPVKESTRNKRIKAIIEANVLDKGLVFENLALKTKGKDGKYNRELEAKWDYIMYSPARAQEYMLSGAEGVKSLNDIIAEVENTDHKKDFYQYMYHKHNIDRMSLRDRYKDKNGNPMNNKPVFGDAVTSKMSKEIVDEYEKLYPEFKDFAQDVYDYMTHLRNLMVESGIITKQSAKLWSEMYPYYVPINRGGENGLKADLDLVGLDTSKEDGISVNAPIKKATGGSSNILPLFETMASRTMQTYKAIAKNNFGVELKNALGTVISDENAEVDDVIDSIDSQDSLLEEGKNGKNPTFTIFENGKRVTFEVTKDMYDALKPLSESSILNKSIPVVNQISSIRRGLITEFNPAFMLTNPIKDVQDILINSQHPLKTYKKLPEAFAQIKKKGYWYDEYIKNGGSQNTIFDNEKGTFKTSNKGIARMLEVPPLSTISKINQTIEMLPRLAEYIASREDGASVEVAMLDAARVTTNFKAGGNVTKFLNRNGCTFLNASVQGFMQQIRNFREAKANGVKGYMNLATKFAIAGLPVFLLNHLIWDDDEEYEELSDYIKQNYYVVWKDDNGQFVRVPKGRMLAVIQDGFAQMENLITGNDEVDLDSFLSLVANNVAPTNPADNNILAPINQVRKNETWYGEDLVPTRLQDLPNAEQYDESTDTLSKWLGEKLDISPVKINYLIDQYSGAIGDVFLPMMTPEAESGNDSFGGELIAPIKDKFTADAIMDNQNISDFYDKSDELTKNANSSKATDEDKLKSKYFSSMQSQISALYKQKREIQNSNLKDSKKYKEVRQIQEEIIGLCKEAMENYSNVTIDGNYATVGGVSYRNDNGNWTKVNDDQMSKQQEAMDKFGISGSEYWDNKDEYSYAVDNPEKYLVSQAIADFDDFSKYKKDISKIEADKDENGKSINGSRKEKVIDYINNLDIDRGAKKILIKMNYPSEDKYNEDIVEYLSERDDISYDEMKTILKELGFTVKSDGTVTW